MSSNFCLVFPVTYFGRLAIDMFLATLGNNGTDRKGTGKNGTSKNSSSGKNGAKYLLMHFVDAITA